MEKGHGTNDLLVSGTPEIIGTTIAAAYKSATAVNAVQFKPNGGVNFTSGTIRLYGIAKV